MLLISQVIILNQKKIQNGTNQCYSNTKEMHIYYHCEVVPIAAATPPQNWKLPKPKHTCKQGTFSHVHEVLYLGPPKQNASELTCVADDDPFPW